MMVASVRIVSYATIVLAHIAMSGTIRPQISSPAGSSDRNSAYFGMSIESVIDLDGDRIPDIAIGDPTVLGATSNRVWLISGADLELIDTLHSDVPGFGAVLRSVPDVNGDGADDLLIGALGGEGQPSLFAYDLKAKEYIWSAKLGARADLARFEYGFGVGLAIAHVHDVDEDGVADVVVGSCRRGVNGGDGYCTLLSASTGKVLWEVSRPGQAFGAPIVGIGDVDDDATGDIVVGGANGSVEVLSLITGKTVRQVLSPCGDAAFGSVLTACMDLDADGVADYLASNAFGGDLGECSSRVWAISSLTGEVIFNVVIDGLDYGGVGTGIVALKDYFVITGANEGFRSAFCRVDWQGEEVVRFRPPDDEGLDSTFGLKVKNGWGATAQVIGDIDNDGIDDLGVASMCAVCGWREGEVWFFSSAIMQQSSALSGGAEAFLGRITPTGLLGKRGSPGDQSED